MVADPYYKKTIEFNYQKKHFVFDVANTIFSTFDVDIGSQLLLRTITNKDFKSLLDIGCGYGALSVILGSLYQPSRILMIDKDLLSIRYAKNNIEKNSIKNAEVLPSIGLENVEDEKFDLIVSNIPAKIGDTAIEKDFILKPLEHLNDEGEYWFVVVSALNRLIPEIISKHKLNGRQIVKKNRYAVYRLTKN